MPDEIYVKVILVAVGAGFIGSAFIPNTIKQSTYTVANVDSLTYAGNF